MKNILQQLTRLRNRYLIGIDTLGLLVIPALAFLLRTESWDLLVASWRPVALYTVGMIMCKWVALYRLGFYRALWAYASVHELLLVVRGVVIVGMLETCAFLVIIAMPLQLLDGFPRSIPLLSALLTAFHIAGVRFTIRVIFAIVSRRDLMGVKPKPVLIAGAGGAGIAVARELQRNRDLGLMPVGFVDDDPRKCSKMICGVPVFGAMEDIPHVVERLGVKEVIIAMSVVPGSVIRKVAQICKDTGVPSKITPGYFDVLRGTARVVNVRDIQLGDLLRREVRRADAETVIAAVAGARVLVTGAGGSIGSEIVRQLRYSHPAEMILVGHGETSIFHIMRELEEHPVKGMAITPVIADVRDEDRMQQVFREHRPHIVFHAAAHKHVWLMEENLPDAVTNNVMGTRVMVDLSEKFGVNRFVMISSDKAVNPTSVMGVTKRVAELIVQDAAMRTGRGFVTVRFGNVLGSRGSVVPIFKRQVDVGGPVTVTHPDVTRYFMTIPEAVHLVLQAGSMGSGGEVFVLDMGKQLKVVDIARDVIRLSGYTEAEIGISFTGLKPGEKMYEELFYNTDDIERSPHPMIRVSRRNHAAEYGGASGPGSDVVRNLRTDVGVLVAAALRGDEENAGQLLQRIVPQYTPASHYDAEHDRVIPAGVVRPAAVRVAVSG